MQTNAANFTKLHEHVYQTIYYNNMYKKNCFFFFH